MEWDLEDTLESWQNYSMPRELAATAIGEIRKILETASVGK
jgi:hypothetical protein